MFSLRERSDWSSFCADSDLLMYSPPWRAFSKERDARSADMTPVWDVSLLPFDAGNGVRERSRGNGNRRGAWGDVVWCAVDRVAMLCYVPLKEVEPTTRKARKGTLS